MLAEFLDIDDNINISFHIKAVEQTEAIKMVKRKNTDIDKMKIKENKKAVRSGYDMDILPSDLITYGDNIKLLLKDLQTRDPGLHTACHHGVYRHGVARAAPGLRPALPE